MLGCQPLSLLLFPENLIITFYARRGLHIRDFRQRRRNADRRCYRGCGRGNDLSDAVMIDESIDASDFITLSDDTIMLSDADMLDTYSTDIDGSDISFIL